MIFIAGPCLAETKEIVFETAEKLAELFRKYSEHQFYFKSSYKKANRSSLNSHTGVGDEIAINWIAEAGKKFGLNTLTDIHTPQDAEFAAQYVDVLQIPAFLSRQTDLLKAAAKTGKIVNIKKGQFLAPEDMKQAALKATGAEAIWLTERGTFFGYHDLVVDFRSLMVMRELNYPVIYDVTHSVQQPSIGECSGGLRQYAERLAYAAVAVGVDGLFFETHPNPNKALCDAATQMPLNEVPKFIENILSLNQIRTNISL